MIIDGFRACLSNWVVLKEQQYKKAEISEGAKSNVGLLTWNCVSCQETWDPKVNGS